MAFTTTSYSVRRQAFVEGWIASASEIDEEKAEKTTHELNQANIKNLQ